MSEKFADLHLHTRYSDGTYSPEELVEQARKHGLTTIALTDHDTVEGCEATAQACEKAGIEFICGSELTAEQDGDELHILGYFLDTGNRQLLGELAKFQQVRQDRVRQMVARLNEIKVPLDEKAVFRIANCQSPGRPHVARALVAQGLCHSLDEAFDRFLKKSRPAWVPKFKMSARRAIELIHQAGGIAVMAHPGLNRADHVIPRMVEAGLDGLECFHTKHNRSVAQHYENMAKHYGLLITGGSDCHGDSKGRPLIGTVKLPYEHVCRMREAREARLGSNVETP